MAFSYKSAISFGLVFVPVTLHLTVRAKDVGFNLLHKESGERIRYVKTCDECPEVVTQADIVRGYQYEKGKYITITDEEIEKIKTERDKKIEIENFVAIGDIDPLYFEKSYFVKPTGAEKAFKLILEALQSEGKVGIAKTVLGQKEQLVALRAVNGQMLLYTLHFHDEVQASPVPQIDEKITAVELDLAKGIIANMTTKFDPTQYKDTYRERLMDAINKKIAGQSIKNADNAKARTAKVLSLMDALKASIESTKNPKSKSGRTKEAPKKNAEGKASGSSKKAG